MTYRLIIGNRNYSTWSMRAGLAIRLTGADFQEEVIPLNQPDTIEALLKASPSGKVPVLIDGDINIHDSLAIGEYLSERHLRSSLWPSDAALRASARSVTSEMHSSFSDLRQEFPMNIRRMSEASSREPITASAAAMADIARINSLWDKLLMDSGGPFLFGEFSLADAFFAPVAIRFLGYNVAVNPVAKKYCTAIYTYPGVQDWVTKALTEPWINDAYEK